MAFSVLVCERVSLVRNIQQGGSEFDPTRLERASNTVKSDIWDGCLRVLATYALRVCPLDAVWIGHDEY